MKQRFPDLLRGKWTQDYAARPAIRPSREIRRRMAFEAAMYQMGRTGFTTEQILDRYLEQVAA